MKKAGILKRYLLFFVSIVLIGIGVAFAKYSELGISPATAVANVISIRFTFLTFGSWTIISNLFFVLVQIIILRRNFKPFQFLQIPLAFLIGGFTDLGLMAVSVFECNTYFQRLIILLIGNFILALGISSGVKANVLLNSPEGFVKAVSDTFKKEFSMVKVIYDICWVAIAVALSLAFFGRLEGVREGTVISAFLVGFFVKLINRVSAKPKH